MPAAGPKVQDLLAEMEQLRESCLELEREFEASIAEACPESRCGVRNLLHYLALRKHDLRDLQTRLTALGLSSLGRAESNVLAGVDAVIAVLRALTGEQPFVPPAPSNPFESTTGSSVLAAHADLLLGPAPKGRAVRIMVTMPSEAAQRPDLIRELVGAGMEVMRVNCAHDSAREWEAMIAHMRRANLELGKNCKVLMDLAGPKLRTGPIHRGSHLVRWRAGKNGRGDIIAPAHIALFSRLAAPESLPLADARLPVPEALLRAAQTGDTIGVTDSRRRIRKLTVIQQWDHICLCTCQRGAWVPSRAELSLVRDGREIATGHVGDLPFVEEPVLLRPGDSLVLTRHEDHIHGPHRSLPHISCTLPEAFSTALPGQPIFFDDGKIEGRIKEVCPDHMLIDILRTGGRAAKLGSAKGINLPETDLAIGAMTEKDRLDLDFVVAHADIAGLSFVRRPGDVLELLGELAARGNSNLGLILKIESRPGFDQLPLIMIAALRHHPVGIMVARGDLAIEVGFERLAEIQEEILWLSEAAHIPVVWATQVLETLAKTGMPSRAEVTDAAMGVRAECVMLNKGEHILDAVRFLDHVLHRMRAHHLKKRSMLRRLHVAQLDGALAAV